LKYLIDLDHTIKPWIVHMLYFEEMGYIMTSKTKIEMNDCVEVVGRIVGN